MTETVKIISPIDGSVFAVRPYASVVDIEAAIIRAKAARQSWSQTTLNERQAMIGHFVAALVLMNDEIVPELAWQMGRPIRFGGEKRGVEERARYMIGLATEALAPSIKPE